VVTDETGADSMAEICTGGVWPGYRLSVHNEVDCVLAQSADWRGTYG
jgi:hypothetical protein